MILQVGFRWDSIEEPSTRSYLFPVRFRRPEYTACPIKTEKEPDDTLFFQGGTRFPSSPYRYSSLCSTAIPWDSQWGFSKRFRWALCINAHELRIHPFFPFVRNRRLVNLSEWKIGATDLASRISVRKAIGSEAFHSAPEDSRRTESPTSSRKMLEWCWDIGR